MLPFFCYIPYLHSLSILNFRVTMDPRVMNIKSACINHPKTGTSPKREYKNTPKSMVFHDTSTSLFEK